MKIKGLTDIFFDLDHTLWDFDRNSKHAFQRIFETHRIDVQIDNFIKHYEPINDKYWKLFRENRIDRTQLRRGRLQEAFALLDQDVSLDTIDALADSYIQELPGNNHLFSDAIPVLDHLAKQYRLHIITNGFRQVQHEKIANSGIREFFVTVTTSDDAGVKKPHPDIFHYAIDQAKVLPQHSLMIGDNLEADIEGARRVGMKTLFFNYRKEAVPPQDVAVNRLMEILNYL